MANNTSAALSFTSPSGTTIADFALTRQLGYNNPVAAETHKYFVLYTLGPTHFAGARQLPGRHPQRAQRGQALVRLSGQQRRDRQGTVSRATFPALAGYTGTANVLHLRVGCFNRGTPCSVAAGGGISHILHGSDVTINDPTPPTVTVEALGLLAGGSRSGSDPVTVSASDGAGIRKVELLDVTNPAAPAVVGTEDYARGAHGRQPHLRLQPARALPEPEPRDRAGHRAARGPAQRASCA